MRTYYCEKCDKKIKLDPKTVNARNEKAWCYCTPLTPTRLTEVSWKKDQKKYEGIFR